MNSNPGMTASSAGTVGRTGTWSLAKAISSLDDSQRLSETVLELLVSLVPAASCYAAIYPTRLLAAYPAEFKLPRSGIRSYVEYFADEPLEEGCATLLVDSLKGFEQSEYYRNTYVEAGYADELNHTTKIADGVHIVVGILRSCDQGRFTEGGHRTKQTPGPVAN